MRTRLVVLLLIVLVLIGSMIWRGTLKTDSVAIEPPTSKSSEPVRSVDPPEAAPARRDVPTVATTEAPAAAPIAEPAPAPTIAMHVRITDRATGAPIAGAVIVRAPGEGAALESDADGRCELTALLSVTRTPQFSQELGTPPGFCRVRADGYSHGEFRAEEGHESEDRALDVKLDKAATLAVTLLHRPLLEAGAYEVRAGVQWQDLVQNPAGAVSMDVNTLLIAGACDAQGIAVVEPLCANVPTTIQVFQGKTLVRALPDASKLEAGVRRELEIDLAGGCIVRGRVLDSNGAGVADIGVWIAPKQPENPFPQFETWQEKRCVAKARSDASGHFNLGAVAPGRFWIGPAPAPEVFKNGRPVALDFVGLNTAIDVAADEAAKDVDIHLQRAMFIRGSVVYPDETAIASSVQIFAGSKVLHRVMAFSEEDGTFVIGPLLDDHYSVHAGQSGKYAESLEVDAAAGASDVVLTLRMVDDLTLRVVDQAGGSGIRAKLILSYLDGSRTMFFDTDDAGVLHRSGMLPGRISICAASADGRVGIILSFNLGSEGRLQAAEVLLAPGAKLKVRPADGSRLKGSVYVYQDGILVGFSEVGRDGNAVMSVPPGEVTVRAFVEGPNGKREQTVRLAIGEEREVVIGS